LSFALGEIAPTTKTDNDSASIEARVTLDAFDRTSKVIDAMHFE
jgi:hypothetical protein